MHAPFFRLIPPALSYQVLCVRPGVRFISAPITYWFKVIRFASGTYPKGYIICVRVGLSQVLVTKMVF
jgi:hypothetical protein